MLEHLSAVDKAEVLDKAARYLAAELLTEHKQQQVYSTQQALANRLGCCRATAAKLLAEGAIPYVRLGKKAYRVLESDVILYLKQQKNGAVAR